MLERGSKLVEQDMNMFVLIQTIKKLKAALAILINDDKDLIGEIKDLYIKSSTIYIDPEELDQYIKYKDNFSKFVDEDLREELKYEVK